MSEEFHVVQPAAHNALVEAAYLHRGFNQHESEAAARIGEYAARHGVRTHNAIKALHLDEHFGSYTGGCIPCAESSRSLLGLPPARCGMQIRRLGKQVRMLRSIVR